MSLSERSTVSTSSVTLLASASGSVSAARAGATSRHAAASNPASSFFMIGPLSGSFCVLGCAAFCRLVVEELPDQLLQHHGGLRQLDLVAVLVHRAVAAGLHADILLDQQGRGRDRNVVFLVKFVELS